MASSSACAAEQAKTSATCQGLYGMGYMMEEQLSKVTQERQPDSAATEAAHMHAHSSDRKQTLTEATLAPATLDFLGSEAGSDGAASDYPDYVSDSADEVGESSRANRQVKPATTRWADMEGEWTPLNTMQAEFHMTPQASINDNSDFPTEVTLFPDTDDEGEPMVKRASELWPVPGSRRQQRSDLLAQLPASSQAVVGDIDGAKNLDAGKGGEHQAQAATEALNMSPGVTTMAVRNLTDTTTQQQFLDALDATGFAGTYDFAYLPPKRRGHAFVNFKSTRNAAAFAGVWHESTFLGVREGAVAIDVCPSAVQGFCENTAKWTPDKLAQVKHTPFICQASSASCDAVVVPEVRSGGATTFSVRNLHEYVFQQDFLRALDASGFAGTYDFAYLPCNFDCGIGAGYAFVNFKSTEIAKAFVRMWHNSTCAPVRVGAAALDVVAASIQGFDANASRWTSARKAKVKNSGFLPFIASH